MKKVYSGIGGQAVLNGIMMKNKNEYSIAVRDENKNIVVEKNGYKSFQEKFKFLSLPFLRGIFAMVDSIVLGTKTLTRSAEMSGEEEYEPTKFELWLYKTFGDKTTNVIIGFATIISFIFAIGIFMLLPAGIGQVFKYFIKNEFAVSLFEGLFRIIIFIIYIKIISLMPEIRETFEYHGSEHKCINCIENGWDLNVENVLKASKEHKRCGTSFLVYVMIISILLFMFIPTSNIYERFISRLLLVPLIAGISYEVLRVMGRFDNKCVDILSRPGMWMQGLTTREPNKKQVEVAIRAVEEVFDWKKFKEENFRNDN